MLILFETEKLKLEYEYELVNLIEKSSNQILLEDDFYGDPTCGIIDSSNKWAIIGGIHLTFWTPSKTQKFHSYEFEHISDLRIKDDNTIEILTDPWSEKSSIWELNLNTSVLTKIRKFTDYRNKKYTDNVVW
ncbi:hypothetical protein [uncultured Psychroserpens sp.]|uniref:hypothetical protein n=1 Tax=uncultured Psychroserpens sp. TaxID=255436 RepID=UPI002629C142|nr:hypothetical protein [uncultured Psychroserpens sp.]